MLTLRRRTSAPPLHKTWPDMSFRAADPTDAPGTYPPDVRPASVRARIDRARRLAREIESLLEIDCGKDAPALAYELSLTRALSRSLLDQLDELHDAST
jgi:hypothetical protein